jgi:hypothetical protein
VKKSLGDYLGDLGIIKDNIKMDLEKKEVVKI